ncbi:MAG: DUF4332 domain-containing protein [Acidiferrobacterales bacterium]
MEQVEGTGPSHEEELRAGEVADTDTLLEIGCTKSGRQGLAQKTGIGESQILKWVTVVDLCRIKGVGEKYSELLECAGVDTVKELRNRNPENLTTKMAEVNEQKKLTRRTPSQKGVENWVAQAKTLPPKVEY